MAGAGGACEHDFFDDTPAKVRETLRRAGPLDDVYICNHGAMITTEEQDAGGVFFAAIRDAVGPTVPIVATLDPHGNVSDLMVESVDVVVAYRTDPHVDQVERGQEAAAVMHELWAGTEPHPVFVKLPIVAPNVSLFTDHGPFAELIALGEQGAHPDILNVSILGGLAFSDTAKNVVARSRRRQGRRDQLHRSRQRSDLQRSARSDLILDPSSPSAPIESIRP